MYGESSTSDKVILQYVEGYKIPFTENVVQEKRPKLPLFTDTEFQDCLFAVNDLINKGSIRECQPCKGEFVSSYFLVDKANAKKRFILNLKKVKFFHTKGSF